MHIIVVGAGEVGSHVAQTLGKEGHDVVVIERSARARRILETETSVQVVAGSGTHPSVLKAAGLHKCDMLIAVTTNDEVNLVASKLAKQAGVERTIVRIEAEELRGRSAAAVRDAMEVDLVIDPDDETAHELLGLLEYPGASEVVLMCGGEVVVLGARLQPGAPLVGMQLSEVGAMFEPDWQFMVGAITRRSNTVIPRRDHVLEADDGLRLIARRDARKQVATLLGLARDRPRRIMLLGGGRTARILADLLDDRGAEVVVVDRDPERCDELAERLDSALILNGDITDSELLRDAQVGSFDVVIAMTGEDDANILACLFAKSEGAQETISLAHRLELVPLLHEVGIDAATSPRIAAANGVLRVLRGDVASVATFLEGDAEVVEFEVKRGSAADGTKVRDLHLDHNVLIGAIVRDGNAQIARGRSTLRARDHIVAVAMPGQIEDATHLFG
ncbi:MAG: Trk system potassium transporter TrkA [Acidimicrobiales bacterium]